MKVDDPKVQAAIEWFKKEGWDIEYVVTAEKVEAIMPSGYGSGPAVIDVISLVSAIEAHGAHHE